MLHGKIGSYGITQELLNWLREGFPDKLPSISTDIEQLRFLQGQQKIIDILESEYYMSTEESESTETTINILTSPQK
jgi:CMP-2-keto-3-deoxyoctulosonic acid synthetase